MTPFLKGTFHTVLKLDLSLPKSIPILHLGFSIVSEIAAGLSQSINCNEPVSRAASMSFSSHP